MCKDNFKPQTEPLSNNLSPTAKAVESFSVKAETGKQSPRQANSLNLSLMDERGGELTLSFKIPAREALIASVHRLLRFEFPAARNLKTYERLIKTNVISAGLSKKRLEGLPLKDFEEIYRQLWRHALGGEEQAEDSLLGLILLMEEWLQFIPRQLVSEDIRLLGLREPGKVPRYYYEDGLNREQLTQFLALHGYKTDLLQADHSPDLLSLQYLACRQLSHPLCWTALLDSLSPTELQKFSRLRRLKDIQEVLRREAWYQAVQQTGVTAANLQALSKEIKDFLQSKAMQAIASCCQIPVPVRTLVLVEGETERLLLPLFAQAAGYDFCALGIEIWPAGGKNYMPTLYRDISRHLKANTFMILDRDADSIAEEIRPTLRPSDVLFQIEEGEFEDIYDLYWILQIINRVYQPYPEITSESFQQFSIETNPEGSTQRVQTLKAIWQAHHLGSFDKIAFAQQYAELFSSASSTNLPPSMMALLKAIVDSQLAKD